MSSWASACLADDLIMDLVEGRLADDQLRQVEEHMSTCSDCRMVVAEAAAASHDDDVTARTEIDVPDSWPSRQPIVPLAAGTGVGRYQVRELIGVGGIGAVYAAHDPELHRMVALKVLRSTELADGGPAGNQRARLLREARAMAQLNHPNVVTVYDAGAFEDQVFLAMELVEGTTLKRWLRAAPRSIEDIVCVFTAAGQGLSAAHRIGLVHRDFKPENVLVGHDGRVRVTDFGLARPANWESTGLHRAVGASGRTWAHATLTRTGVFAGTPAYMAPEQFAGEAPDLRTDQFSFCVALYEAVYRQRPFGGDTLDQIAQETLSGRLRRPPAGAPVPDTLRDAIVRGLRHRRDDRFASMDDLLGALALSEGPAPAQRPRRTGWIALAGAAAACAVAAGAIAIGLAMRSGPHPAARASRDGETTGAPTAAKATAAPASLEPAPASLAPAPASLEPAPASLEPAPASLEPAPAQPTPAQPTPVALAGDTAASGDAIQLARSPGDRHPGPRHRATPPERRHRAHDPPRDDDAPTPTAHPAAHWVGDGLRDPFATHGTRSPGKEPP